MLAGLMMQESRGQQYAKSPTGAIGYFQTTSGYRKDMGMSREDSYDLIKSGTKAIDFLVQSYREFGDWESAIRSYNAGRGGTRQFNRTGRVTGSEARNKEVREYVPKINKWSAWFNSGNGGLGKNQDIAKQNQAFLENEQKNLEKLAKMREQIEVRFMDRYTKQQYEFKKQLEEIDKAEFDENTATGWKQLIKYRFDETQAYHKKSTDLELNGYRLNALEKLKIEKELAQHKTNLSTELSREEKAIHYQAIEDKYAFDVEQYQLAQQKKVDEFEKAFKQTRNSGYMAEYNDVMYQKYLSPHQYNKWQLDRTHESNKSDEEGRYNDVLKSINEKDETGNFAITDFNERSRLLQEAKIIHEEQMYAITALYSEKTRQLEADNLSMTLQGYGSTFGALSGLVKDYAGEQSSAYRAMFAVSKSFALAQVGVKMGEAIGQAWADPSAVTTWQKVANVAKVTIEQGHLINMINAINPKGFATGGYTGNMGVNQIAGVVHGQEYVLNAKATRRIGVNNLERLNNGGGIGGNVNNINVHVTVNSDGSNVQADTQMGKQMGEAMAKIARQVMIQETKQNGHLDRLYRR
ncbi:transglycosylase SLT domain-containing protein [Moraxella bovis]